MKIIMERHVVDIFPTTIVSYHKEDYLKTNCKLLELFDKEEFVDGVGMQHPKQSVDNHLENREEYRFLYDWFDECLEDMRTMFDLDTEKLRVCLSWANTTNGPCEHRTHLHPNSWFSGIYYVSDSPAPTYFETPVMQQRHGILVQSKSMDTRVGKTSWQCPGTSGDLVLFPSWLEHFVMPDQNTSYRATISINIMPVGVTSTRGLVECVY